MGPLSQWAHYNVLVFYAAFTRLSLVYFYPLMCCSAGYQWHFFVPRLGGGSESYAPLARALIGGLSVSVLFTVFLVPAGFDLANGRPWSGGRMEGEHTEA